MHKTLPRRLQLLITERKDITGSQYILLNFNILNKQLWKTNT